MKVMYGEVVIEFASITEWNETCEYDETGVNLVANKILITVEGSVFPESINSTGDKTKTPTDVSFTTSTYNAAHGTPAPFGWKLNMCLRSLSFPRQLFEMSNPITGDIYFIALPYDEDIVDSYTTYDGTRYRNLDVNNGPKPISVRVLQTFNEFARISFTIEITKIRCLGGEVQGASTVPLGSNLYYDNIVISNRFWTEEIIDSNFYTTRTITGKLKQPTSNSTSVHQWRDFFYPPLEFGYRRDMVRYSESPDGTELSYVIVDKQMRCAAPYPATNFTGSCTFSIDNQAVMIFSFQLMMTGRPDAPKKLLLQRCVEAFVAKVKNLTKDKKASGVIKDFSISESLGDPPSVTLNAKMLLTATVSEDQTMEDAILKVSLPGMQVLGEPLEWDKVKLNDKWEVTYNRIRSDVPNPFGYETYYVYEEAPKDSDDDQAHTVHSFIKCVATVPCRIITQNTSSESQLRASSEEEVASKTTVAHDPSGTDYGTQTESSTGVLDNVVDSPYTFYKSNINYYTDYSNIVLPQAHIAQNQSSNPYDGQYITTRPPGTTGSGETQTASIQRTTKLVQLARPIPKALVTIEAERVNQLPELPNPDEIITASTSIPGSQIGTESGSSSDTIQFQCLRVETKICDPKPSRVSKDSIIYNVFAKIEYVLSRPFRKGDSVTLLSNPTFGGNGYYPTYINASGNQELNTNSLVTLFNGTQLNHSVVNSTNELPYGPTTTEDYNPEEPTA